MDLTPGLMVIHGNQPESLRDLLVGWMRAHPLSPLESEVILVQSNGIAQWLKLALARDVEEGGCGVTASMSVELPAQFLWRAYRGVLGRDRVPDVSALDEAPLVWRLMRLLPALIERPVFAVLRRYLADDADLRKRHQLAQRLADLFDQYQVYRADWLEDWHNGHDRIQTASGGARMLSPDEQWQPELWRALIADVGDERLSTSRAGVHRHFLEALEHAGVRPAGLPRRVIVFGISAMPAQSVEALAAIARFSQVLLCVHNPCRHHWADIVADKDLLRHEYRRQRRRPGMPVVLDDDLQHQYAHPLLAAWGKQGRDYINLLDRYDDPERYRGLFGDVSNGRIDLFSDDTPHTLLAQLQNDILELRPLAESRALWPALDPQLDASVRFHVAHSAQREVEVLHDQLLARFDADPTLHARDVIVMVPDVNTYAPHIEAVFGQVARDDRRFVPYTLADQGQRGREPMLVALELLLRLPDSRFAVSEILDLLDVAALRTRFGIAESDLPLLRRWIDGAGVRWGLDGAQRKRLGLPAADEANSWRFGLRRMLLGFAVGEGESFRGIEPYAEIGGLDASLLGPLAQLLAALDAAAQRLAEPATPSQWVERLRLLLETFFIASDEHDDLLHQQMLKLLDAWLDSCNHAEFDQAVPVTVVREAWLGGLDAGGLNQRFLAGAVSFCTLMPMRAIPFRVVCLLGMNDGDYPRVVQPLDFDLMRNDYRPGDRSRREDDRYLLLEALLSAREQLYVSWVGRSIRDNSTRPPSVLIGQLRDHLAAGWRRVDGGDVLVGITREHPLQPFSRAYFPQARDDAGIDGAFTYAREWREVYRQTDAVGQAVVLPDHEVGAPIALRVLQDFVADPVKAFFAQRLKVRFGEAPLTDNDDEPFVLDGLDNWKLTEALVQRLRPVIEAEPDVAFAPRISAEVSRLRGEGRLPVGAFGTREADDLIAPLPDLLQRYRDALAAYPMAEDAPREIQHQHTHVMLADWVTGLRTDASGALVRIELISGKLHEGDHYRWHTLVRHWVAHLARQLCGVPVSTWLVGTTGDLIWAPVPLSVARLEIDSLIDAWREGLRRPLPVACRTAFAWLDQEDEVRALTDAERRYEGGYNLVGEVQQSPALARAYPDFDSLYAEGDFEHWAEALYGTFHRHVLARDDQDEESA
ncbi:MAG: exodeoxyribonuclease V subunit gamma [Rhodocyclaceae bacterium]